MNALRDHLMALPPGAVLDTNGLDGLLADCWGDLERAYDGGMEASKLLGRMESIHWQPPILTFVIERHGGTVCGSTRAELQHWEVDVERSTATIVKTGQRQVAPMSRRVSVTPMAQEVAEAALQGKSDERLRWLGGDCVHVVTSRAFPTISGCKRTIEGGRKRLANEVAEIVAKHGWESIGRNRFTKGAR